MSLPRVFFVGLGNMGAPMAQNLLRAGYPLTVFDIDATRLERAAAGGARVATHLAEGAADASVVITSLPGPAQVRTVVLGDEGLLGAMKPGATLIDTSTSAVELAREIAAAAAQRSVHYLEAPVTNAIDGAARGELSIFIGGDEQCCESQRALFETLGNKLFYVGAHGNAATVKLLTNLLWFVSAAAIGEALMLGAKAGVPLTTVWEAIKASAGNSWVVEHDVPSIFAGHYDPSFSLALCCKDLGLVNAIADEQGYPLAMGRFAQTLFEKARATYGDEAAELHVVRLLEEQAGLLLRPPHGVPLNAEA